MKIAYKMVLIMAGIFSAVPGFAADDPNINAIKARQGEMFIRAFNVGPLFAMAKGDMEYDAVLAGKLAGNLKLLLDLDTSRDWPAGSDSDSYPDDTKALPGIWTTYPEIGEYAQEYDTAVIELSAVAGNGLEAMQSKIGAVGESCKGCHDEYEKE